MSNNQNNNIPEHVRDLATKLSACTITVGTPTPDVLTSGDAEQLAKISPNRMVAEIEERIATIQCRLAETDGFDKATGNPIYRVAAGTHARKALDLELYQLQTQTLPFTQLRAAEIAAVQATLPSSEDLARIALERQARIDARAKELTEEIEAKQKAERMVAERRRIVMGA